MQKIVNAVKKISELVLVKWRECYCLY